MKKDHKFVSLVWDYSELTKAGLVSVNPLHLLVSSNQDILVGSLGVVHSCYTVTTFNGNPTDSICLIVRVTGDPTRWRDYFVLDSWDETSETYELAENVTLELKLLGVWGVCSTRSDETPTLVGITGFELCPDVGTPAKIAPRKTVVPLSDNPDLRRDQIVGKPVTFENTTMGVVVDAVWTGSVWLGTIEFSF